MSHQSPNREELRLYQELGFHPRSLVWPKMEILLGLLAVSVGHLLSIYTIVHAGPRYFWLLVAASVVLQSLGGYLALAGHRSHLYQAQNKLTAWLAAQIAKRA